MDELLTYVVQNLVNHPDDVRVNQQSSGGQVDLLLTVNPEDMGLIIGKGGQTIKSIRKLLITKAIVENVRVNLQLDEPEGYVKPEKNTDPTENNKESAAETNPEQTKQAEEENSPQESEEVQPKESN